MPEDKWAQYEVKQTKADDPWSKYEVKTATPSPTLMESRRQASKAEFEQNLPPSTPWSRARELALGATQGLGLNPASPVSSVASGIAAIPELMNPRGQMNAAKAIGQNLIQGPQQAIQGIQQGDYDKMAGGVGQTISADLPAIYGAAKGAQALIPSTERAGAKFAQIAKTQNPTPINTRAVDAVASDIKKWASHSNDSVPPVVRKYMVDQASRIDPMTGQNTNPMTYEEGRQFSSGASALSAKSIRSMSNTMKAKVGEFAAALRDANRNALPPDLQPLYDEAMKEYSQAKTLQNLGNVAKKYGKWAAIGAALGGGEEVVRRNAVHFLGNAILP